MQTMAWPMEPDEVMQVLRAIQFEHYKWDIFHRGDTSILPEALILSPQEHQSLISTAEQIWEVILSLEPILCSDPDLLHHLAIPASLHPAILHQRPEHPRVTRCDFHLTEQDQWVISEFNNDVPSGFAESVGLAAVLTRDWADRFPNLSFQGDLRQALLQSLRPFPTIGLVHATGYSEDLQHVALVGEWLEADGHATILASPANLQVRDGRAYLFETPVDAIFRYYPGEWIGDLPNARDWEEAAAFLPMMNPLSALTTQSKRFYASWQEDPLPLSPPQRELLDTFIPTSRYLSSIDAEELLSHPKKWVLKGSFGRMGDTVRIAHLMPPGEWEIAVEDALKVPDHIAAQQRFDISPLWTSRGLGYATIGVYLVDGRFAGYFSRIDKGPLIDYDSWYVPTLVRTS